MLFTMLVLWLKLLPLKHALQSSHDREQTILLTSDYAVFALRFSVLQIATQPYSKSALCGEEDTTDSPDLASISQCYTDCQF